MSGLGHVISLYGSQTCSRMVENKYCFRSCVRPAAAITGGSEDLRMAGCLGRRIVILRSVAVPLSFTNTSPGNLELNLKCCNDLIPAIGLKRSSRKDTQSYHLKDGRELVGSW